MFRTYAFVLAGWALGCSSRAELTPCDEPYPLTCPSSTCGGNSPVANAFPINGLRSDGECSPEGVRLVPKSLMSPAGSGPCEGATLDVELQAGDSAAPRSLELVGRDRHGDVVCRGDELQGATFELQSWQRLSARIKIAKIDPTYTSDLKERRVAYRLENADDPGKDLCDQAASTTLRKALGLRAIDNIADLPAPEHGLVIPVRSEIYDIMGRAVEISQAWKLPVREWLHLACVDDALAKRSLYDLHTDNLSRSRAALRMLTADYCGGSPATVRGIKIKWRSDDPNDLIEARWSEAGATCLSHPRLLHTKGPAETLPPTVPTWLRDGCSGSCTPSQLDTAMRSCHKDLVPIALRPLLGATATSFPESLPPCAPCPDGGCSPRTLETFDHWEAR